MASGPFAHSGVRHLICGVRDFEMVGNDTLRVGFNDGTERVIDLIPVLTGELFCPLSYPALFNQFRVDPEVQRLVWPNGADFAPATLHDRKRPIGNSDGLVSRTVSTIIVRSGKRAEQRETAGEHESPGL